MAAKSSVFGLYRTFVDAFMKGHPEMTRYACHYNAQAEWNQIKTNEDLIKKKIEEYLDIWKEANAPKKDPEAPDMATVKDEITEIKKEPPSAKGRKRSLSSDSEGDMNDPTFDPNLVVPVIPTFSHRRTSASEADHNDTSKPWVVRSLEKARARVDAKAAKIQAARAARANRIKTPAQEAIVEEMKEISDKIVNLMQVKNMGLSTSETQEQLRQLIKKKKERASALGRLQSIQRALKRYRQRKKERIERLCNADPEVAAELLKLYRPTILPVYQVNDSPDLLQVIEEIAQIGGANETNPHLFKQQCASLDELREKIKERGYEIKRSALYYRLLPVRVFSTDGKRHVTTGPVRLRKYQNITEPKHEDCHFIAAILRHIKDLVETFGNDCVFYLIQDSKAKVKVGRPASKENAPLIMHLDYQVSSATCTPAQTIVRHQLTPTVFAACIIDDAGRVTHAGPTFIPIRSAKHERITTDTDSFDFDRVVKLKEFERTARDHLGFIKPIIIWSIDSLIPNDYTRFPKTLAMAIDKFKKYNLDALFILTQAPGQALFNVVERRLAPLSHDLAGLVLPQDYFGTHLTYNGFTADAELEKDNLKQTGETLAEVWNMNLIDEHPIFAEYVEPPASTDEKVRMADCAFTLESIIEEISANEDEEEIPLYLRFQTTPSAPLYDWTPTAPKKQFDAIDEYWCATHVFQTQYTIQIIRCTKSTCCRPWRSNYIQVFPHRFLPPPVPFNRSSRGIKLVNIESSSATINPISPFYGTLFQRIQFHGIVMKETQSQLLPFDAHCPSLQSRLHSRLCSICKQYIPSAMRLRNHYKVHQQQYASNCLDYDNHKEEELMEEIDPIDLNELSLTPINPAQNGVCLFVDMIDWLRSDFEDDPIVDTKTKSIAANAMAQIRKDKQLAAAAAAAANSTTTSTIVEQQKEQSRVTSQDHPTITTETTLQPSASTISLNDTQTTTESACIIDAQTDNGSMMDAMERLDMLEDGNISISFPSQSSPNQCDDLDDLIGKI